MAAVLKLACLGLSVAAVAADAPPSSCKASGGAQCSAQDAAGQLAKEQMLLQLAPIRSKLSASAMPVLLDDGVRDEDLGDGLGEDAGEAEELSKEDKIEAEAWERKMAEIEPETDAGGNSGSEQVALAQRSHCGGEVRRRRRAKTMTACRRRHSSPGHHDSDSPTDMWKCNADTHEMECTSSPSVTPRGEATGEETHEDTHDGVHIGWPSEGPLKAADLWCRINVPPSEWNLKSCPTDGTLDVKVLSYNLFWWNLFKKHGGGERSAGRLIARTSGEEMYDFMAFQECDDRSRVLADAKASGLAGEYGTIDGGRAIAMAYLKSRWELLQSGRADVGEDSRRQYYGKRGAVWARLRHTDNNKTVFFMSHHGPLRVNEGGGCTGAATALHLTKTIAEHAHLEDAIILTGDFNARESSSRVQELSRRLNRVFSGRAMGGIDHIFTNCGVGVSGQILGKGDGHYKSDHDAISATLKI